MLKWKVCSSESIIRGEGGTYQKWKGALLVPEKGHLLEIKKGTYSR